MPLEWLAIESKVWLPNHWFARVYRPDLRESQGKSESRNQTWDQHMNGMYLSCTKLLDESVYPWWALSEKWTREFPWPRVEKIPREDSREWKLWRENLSSLLGVGLWEQAEMRRVCAPPCWNSKFQNHFYCKLIVNNILSRIEKRASGCSSHTRGMFTTWAAALVIFGGLSESKKLSSGILVCLWQSFPSTDRMRGR